VLVTLILPMICYSPDPPFYKRAPFPSISNWEGHRLQGFLLKLSYSPSFLVKYSYPTQYIICPLIIIQSRRTFIKSSKECIRVCALGRVNVWKPNDDFPNQEPNKYKTVYWYNSSPLWGRDSDQSFDQWESSTSG